ncbi:hypothetical protein FK220_012525 [Flavobacteriaceae bacterium TP-CH-4]|uniref:Peptidase MA-like domain-containing protein n=1 Tax=Pelagihabitans pacificus TaxID=2696054 RepID=A0A967ATT2_9FLAO|nr:peptidase MA family metallohydrolase [Pelagihabitans pacificus]NHF60173.1 hypothetical protein [Pelagihabitans pacificus]
MKKKNPALIGRSQKCTLVFILMLTITACKPGGAPTKPVDSDGWAKETKVSKLIKNVNFIFPESGYAFDNKEEIIKRTFDAIEHNIKILDKKEFTDTIYVRVMSSRDEMFIYTGTRAIGNAYPYWSTLNIVANEDVVNPPIKHELMHLIAMLDWDYPRRNCTWMNEGLATLAANECNGRTVAEIYRFLLEENKLISMEDLSSDFYGQSEMIGYHQSGYMVQYLLENYALEKFKTLWTDGFEKFEEIYGLPYSQVKENLEKVVMGNYPEAPEIDWEKFSKGCK